MRFCDILHSLIENNELTQKQVANDIGVAPSTMGGYVQGTSEPDFETVKLIAAYFGVTTDYLLDFHSGITSEHNEDEILRIFREAADEDKGMFIDIGRAIIKKNKR